MFLSQVELIGFKSFAHKTAIKFNEGITAIVGPNGCGKTNVVDAIRWVLGEQKTSILRSDRMEDVVFSGTMNRRRLGYAEVSIVIENTKNILPVEYSQVMITRRFFRSGESEYLLNKQLCRLKDINNLLMDSGMGADAYSVIELNMVEKILNDSDDYRSRLFEEAAGVMKYKVRRNEALRKLEATRQDIIRIKDIIAEVDRNVNSLRSQVGRASRYESLKAELLTVEKLYFNAKYRELFRKKEPLESEIRKLTNLHYELSGKSAKQQAYIDKTQNEILERQEAVSKAQEILNAVSERVRSTDTTHIKLQERLNALRETEQRLSVEISSTSQKIEETATYQNKLYMEIDGKKIELKTVQEQYEIAVNERNNFLGDYKQKKTIYVQKNQQLFELMKELEELRKKLNTFIRDEQEHRIRLKRVKELQSKSLIRLDELKSIIHQNQQEIEQIELKIQEGNSAKEQTHIQIETTNETIADIVRKINETKIAIESAKTRLQILKNLVEEYGGLPSGVSEVLKVKKSLPGVIGTIGELISVEKEFESAVESALGEQAHYVVVLTYSDCKRAIEYLRSIHRGRASFIVLNSLPADIKPLYKQISISKSGVIPLLEKISAPDYLTNLLTLLLGDFIYVDSDNFAVEEGSEIPPYFKKVTRNGFVSSSGYLFAGGSMPDERTGVVGRKERISELQNEIKVLETELTILEHKLNQQNNDKKQLQDKSDAIINSISTVSYNLQSLKHRQGIVQFELQQVKKTLEEVNKDAEQLELFKYNESITEELESVIKSKEAECNTLHIECEQFQTEEELLERERQQYDEQITEKNNNKTMFTEMINSLTKEINRTQNLNKEYTIALTERQKSLSLTQSQINTLEAQISELRTTLEQLFREQRECENAVLSKKEDLNKFQEEKQEELHEFLEIQKHIASIQETLQANKEQLIEVQQEMKFLNETYQSKGISIDSAMDITEPIDMDTIIDNKQQIIKKLELFGPVNMEAVDEYNKERERLTFLQNQLQDLEEAEETLTDTITKINTTAQGRFTHTFQNIRENFKMIYKKLFIDGEADLVYTEREDPLDAKIDIYAQPFGKKVQSIVLLSGGEKALTAIAILFAVYLVKPSPFCILDEVDAPLDDANISRFINILNEFSRDIQFIIVTHNKKTMEAAQYLYGITMEETGISKIISVRLNNRAETVPFTESHSESVENN
jgi:chromosome segregation protein